MFIEHIFSCEFLLQISHEWPFEQTVGKLPWKSGYLLLKRAVNATPDAGSGRRGWAVLMLIGISVPGEKHVAAIVPHLCAEKKKYDFPCANEKKRGKVSKTSHCLYKSTRPYAYTQI